MADLPDSPPAAAAPTPDWAWDARRAAQLGILTFARFCLNTMLRVVYPFAPAFARGLGVPVTTIYLLISLRNFTGLLSPVFAPLPERYGRRNVMALSMAVFSAAALLVAGVPAVWSLGAALVIDATGALGMAVREVTPTRIAAAGLVLAGLLLSRL